MTKWILGIVCAGVRAAAVICLAVGTCVAADDVADGAGVVRHFVAFKFKDGVTPEEIVEVNGALVGLKDKVDGILSVERGDNMSEEKRNMGFTDGFLFTFRSAKDRDAYLVHPAHKAFLELAGPRLADAFVFDYVADVKERAEVPVAPPAEKIVDLSHVLGPGLPDFHAGNEAFTYKMLYTIPKDGFADGEFTTPEHHGTHVDAPSHFIERGESIDTIGAGRLILPCVVIDVRDEVKKDADYRLTVEKVKAFEEGGVIPAGAAVFLLTGWAERFGDPSAYRNADSEGTMHYPAFGAEAAEYLVKTRKVAAMGLDTISADNGLSKDYPVHKMALGNDVLLIENLNNLDKLPERGAMAFLGPIRIANGTGSPARVLAVLP